MIQAMYNGVSGLRAHKTQMDVISNNIANINTIGFKSSAVSFRQMLSQTIRGATSPRSDGLGGINPMQIGLGVGVGSIDINLVQGSLLPTGKSTDAAIEGNGFFIVSDGQGQYFTRDGSFQLDSDGSLVAAGSGLKVLGWSSDPTTGFIDDAVPISASSTLKLPVGQLAIARQTANVALGGNLNSAIPVGESASASLSVFDSLGKTHNISITFTKTSADDTGAVWSWNATSPDSSAGVSAGTGTIAFGADGRCTAGSTAQLALALDAANGATSPIPITVTLQSVTQYSASNGESTLKPVSQDGLPLGVLDDFTISKDGTIAGTFDNGMVQNLGRIALAQFSNPVGLSRIGNNLLAETGNSGLPQVGIPSGGSLGHLASGFLESSNVDLPTEFANMIVAQRGFQANSRVITTSDEILQDIVQLKR